MIPLLTLGPGLRRARLSRSRRRVMRLRRSLTCAAIATTGALVAGAFVLAPAGQAAPRTAVPAAVHAPANLMGVAPYVYGDDVDLGKVMQTTGVRWFTVAFVLSKGNCNPVWDGEGGLGG